MRKGIAVPVLGSLVCVVCLTGGCAPKRVATHQHAASAYGETLLESLDLAGSIEIPCGNYRGAESMRHLGNGWVYIRGDMQIDADGSPRARVLDPEFGRCETSLAYSGREGPGRFVDSESVPYIVLPQGFGARFDIRLGDLAAVGYEGKVVFAIFADVGPEEKIGEGSIRLAEALGHAPWRQWHAGETLSTHGGITGGGVEYLIFPGSRPAELDPDTINRVIDRKGARLWEQRPSK